MEDISIVGRKAFFIASGDTLVPDSLLERLMSHGYEAYRIADDGSCPMRKKVADIMRLFPGSILYCNVDSTVAGIDWKSYVKELCTRRGADERIGVICRSEHAAEELRQIEDYYRDGLKVAAGVLFLPPDGDEAYERVLESLARAGARGRRKIVRVNAAPSDGVTFPHGVVRLKDVSRAYFCCLFDGDAPDYKIYEHFRSLKLCFHGMSLSCDAVLVMQNCKAGVYRLVFMFVKDDGSPELEADKKVLLNRQIYQILTEERRALMFREFRAGTSA